jgi:hypothetical protein
MHKRFNGFIRLSLCVDRTSHQILVGKIRTQELDLWTLETVPVQLYYTGGRLAAPQTVFVAQALNWMEE